MLDKGEAYLGHGIIVPDFPDAAPVNTPCVPTSLLLLAWCDSHPPKSEQHHSHQPLHYLQVRGV